MFITSFRKSDLQQYMMFCKLIDMKSDILHNHHEKDFLLM